MGLTREEDEEEEAEGGRGRGFRGIYTDAAAHIYTECPRSIGIMATNMDFFSA